MSNNTRVLGFDFGAKRIGVAVGNSETTTANGLCVLQAKNGKPNWDEVKSLINEWQPQRLVVGYPTQFDGSDITATKGATSFANRLQQKTDIKVELMDERLTSHEARALNKALKQDRVDDLAAQIIVQSWLNEKLNPPSTAMEVNLLK